MDKNWLSWNLETFPAGVSSAVSPDLLPANQTAWANNVTFRGAKAQTRPNLACRMVLPSGLVQGVEYFGVQGGMLIAQIAGHMFRVRIGPNDFAYEEIPLGFLNSGIIKQVWMCQTVESLVVQDGQSNAIIYNGSTARRAGPNEVPRGRQMAYGNGRLWVAINANELVAGDIRTRDAGSELSFTETQYLSGGGSLWFARAMTGLAFIPVTGTSDYGTLLVFGRDYAESVRADITDRDSWSTYPGFVTNVLRTIGCVGQWSIAQVNQDLFWRDARAQLRSLRSSLDDESGPGNSSLSREVLRLVDYDSQQLLAWSSAVYFDNRMLFTTSPFLNKQGGVSFRDLAALDFAPISTMQGKTSPAYDGSWQGVSWTKLVSGEFDHKLRAFGVSSDEDGRNRLWEFGTNNVADLALTDGTGLTDGSSVLIESPIECFVEYPRIDFGDPKRWKNLTRFDVWISELQGGAELTAYWRADNAQQWTEWDSVSECATMTDPATTSPHVWKNLLPQQRPLLKSFSIPDGTDDITKYRLSQGFTFQVRLAWMGSLKIQRAVLRANPMIDDPDYVDRTGQEPACVPNDITGNELTYTIPLHAGAVAMRVLSQDQHIIAPHGSYQYPAASANHPETVNFTIQNNGGATLTLGTLTLDSPDGEFALLAQPAKTSLEPGESTTFPVEFLAQYGGDFTATVTIPNNTSDPNFVFDVQGTVLGVHLTVTTYEGKFLWRGYYPYIPSWQAGRVPLRYLTRIASGQNISYEWYGPAWDHAPDGTQATIFSGSQGINAVTGDTSGNLLADAVLSGQLCRGVSYGYFGPLGQHFYRNSPVDGLEDNSGLLEFTYLVVIGIRDATHRIWKGDKIGSPSSYQITGCGNAIDGVPDNNGNNTITQSLSSRMTLAQAAAAEQYEHGDGAVAVTAALESAITAYDSGTGLMTGRSTEIHMVLPQINPAGFYYVEPVLSQTPIGGGPAVIFNDPFFFDGAPGQQFIYDYPLPNVPGYTIALKSITVSIYQQAWDEFEDQSAGWLWGVPAGYVNDPHWTENPFFGMVAPFTESGCDWTDFSPDAVGKPILTDLSGWYWAGDATFSMQDNEQATDDFTNYAVGDLPALTAGLGWMFAGYTLIFDLSLCHDDLASYAAGPVTELDYGLGDNPFNCWVAVGTFAAQDNLLAFDDFAAYSTGNITTLTFGTGSSPTNCWQADGTFG